MTNYRTMFVNTNYELKEETGEGYHLQVEIEENENCVKLRAASMCIYFKEDLIEMLKKKHPNKVVKVGYNSNIPLRFYTYREFMKGKGY